MYYQRVTLACCLFTISTFAANDITYKSLQDEGRSSFAPTSTNTMTRQGAPPPQPMIYAQNRDSYASAAGQQTYTVPAVSQGGTAAAASSSYAAPATGGAQGGYGQSPGQSMTYYYYHYPAQQQQGGYGGYGESTGYDDDGFDASSLGGLAGLLGLKGLKGLGGLGLLALLKLLKKLFLPLLLPFLLLLPLLLLFIPVPVITIPAGGNGRTLDTSEGVGSIVANKAYQTAQVAQEVLTSAMCVERIACELSARAHGTYLDKVITQLFEKTESMSSKKWKRAMRAYIDTGFKTEVGNRTSDVDTGPGSGSHVTSTVTSACSKYVCDLYKEVTSRLAAKSNANSTVVSSTPVESGGNEVPT